MYVLLLRGDGASEHVHFEAPQAQEWLPCEHPEMVEIPHLKSPGYVSQ